MGMVPATDSVVLVGERNEVRLSQFEGPLDLLLHLIRKNEIDIYDIPIALITEQYLQYLQLMRDLNINLAGEFLEMAATLIYIKSKMMLPPDPTLDPGSPEAEDPRTELVERLLEYERFRGIAQTLYTAQELEAGMYSATRLSEVEGADEELLSVNLFDLIEAFRGVLKRYEDQITVQIEREAVTVADKIEMIRTLLKSRRTLRFSQLLQGIRSRIHLVALFFAILELTRMREITARQEELFAEILITRRREAA